MTRPDTHTDLQSLKGVSSSGEIVGEGYDSSSEQHGLVWGICNGCSDGVGGPCRLRQLQRFGGVLDGNDLWVDGRPGWGDGRVSLRLIRQLARLSF